MNLFSSSSWSLSLVIFTLFVSSLLLSSTDVSGSTFSFINKCDYTVWPGILASSGSPTLETTGFELSKGTYRTLQAPTGWSGRFWGRTLCNLNGSDQWVCETGDCGSGQLECNGAGAAPPATLAEFTLGSGATSGSDDFYDVSLVDGYNLPLVVEPSGGSGSCVATGCVTDLNKQCPTELRVGNGQACKSACEAFGTPEYCCSGEYGNPNTCRPSVYSEMFKSACPRSYSYAYDDATSTFTCMGADYIITFCPSYSKSQKSSRDSSPKTTEGESGSGSSTPTSTQSEGEMLADGSWLAGLAAGDSTRNLASAITVAATTTILILTFFYL
ncbi:hypothetical protein MKW94_026906 [Papaver nudicaule]|uniref:Thaumatin-like protein 1b n=1 Tax=Papaver nudicaule TaxID=74823 RepID=A0AA42AST0_PAPNU|nr:hypothetical protein [Papaver nudicaule]